MSEFRAIPSTRRLILSGTPIQNNLLEMWALFDFVTPGLLGSAAAFMHNFEARISRGQSRDASYNERQSGAEAAASLRSLIAPAFLRREKRDVLGAVPSSEAAANMAEACTSAVHSPATAAAADSGRAVGSQPTALPPKHDLIVWLRPSPQQRRLYTGFLGSASVAAALNKTGSALAAISVLKKICDHPCLLPQAAAAELARGGGAAPLAPGSSPQEVSASCKSAFCIALLQRLRAGGHRTLVFSQSLVMLDVLEAAARSRGWRLCRIDGGCAPAERQARVAAFQEDATIPLFLLTSQVGGLGLTITAADRVVIIDPAWNPSVDSQSVDRAYRIGQTRPVVVYRLVTCGTVEEKIYRKQVYKGGLSRAGTESADPMRYFTQGELSDLFRVVEGAFDASATHQHLATLHGAPRVALPGALEAEVAAAEASPWVAGVSQHDRLFAQPDRSAAGSGAGGSQEGGGQTAPRGCAPSNRDAAPRPGSALSHGGAPANRFAMDSLSAALAEAAAGPLKALGRSAAQGQPGRSAAQGQPGRSAAGARGAAHAQEAALLRRELEELRRSIASLQGGSLARLPDRGAKLLAREQSLEAALQSHESSRAAAAVVDLTNDRPAAAAVIDLTADDESD